MNTLVDTHVWVWWSANPAKLSRPARSAIEKAVAAGACSVSVISCWEVATLAEKGRLTLGIGVLKWIHDALDQAGIALAPMTPEIAVMSTNLPGRFHDDPADQIVVATARHLAAQLVTADQRIQRYPQVRTVW